MSTIDKGKRSIAIQKEGQRIAKVLSEDEEVLYFNMGSMVPYLKLTSPLAGLGGREDFF